MLKNFVIKLENVNVNIVVPFVISIRIQGNDTAVRQEKEKDCMDSFTNFFCKAGFVINNNGGSFYMFDFSYFETHFSQKAAALNSGASFHRGWGPLQQEHIREYWEILAS